MQIFDYIRNGNIKSFKKCLNENTVNSYNKHYETPLSYALKMGRKNMVEILVSFNECRINLYHSDLFITPLMIMCRLGYFDLVKKILSKRSYLTEKYFINYIIMKRYHDPENVIHLFKNSLLNTIDKNGNTPLIWCIKSEYIGDYRTKIARIKIAKMLIEQGADPYVKNICGQDFFHFLHKIYLPDIQESINISYRLLNLCTYYIRSNIEKFDVTTLNRDLRCLFI